MLHFNYTTRLATLSQKITIVTTNSIETSYYGESKVLLLFYNVFHEVGEQGWQIKKTKQDLRDV